VAGHRRIAAIEDAARLRDALGVVLPPGIPDAHLEPVDDPLADVVTRFARTHGPFTIDELTDELGVSPAVLGPVIDRLVTTRRLLRGEFLPGGRGAEIIDADVLRKVRRRSVARLREEIEPVEMERYAAFLPAWQGVLTSKDEDESESGADLVEVMDRLSALAVPASSVMSILRARMADVQPTQVDALLARGSLTWWSMGPLGARDARIAWAPTAIAAGMRELLRGSHPRLADTADDDTLAIDPVARAIVDVLAGGGAFYADAVHAALISTGPIVSVDTVDAILWDLARDGWVTCDSFSYLLARVGSKARSRSRTPSSSERVPRSGQSRHRAPARPRLPRRTRLSSEGGGGATGPRWSLAPGVASPADSSSGPGGNGAAQQRYAAEYCGLLLERWAVVTRMSVAAEDPVGGFSGQYRVLSAMADAGACQRIYAIEGAGGAQFALEGAVDAIRDHREFGDHEEARAGRMLVLSAVDPANPYGTLLSWPTPEEPPDTTGRRSARPSRRAGSLVVLHGSELLAWLDPSGGSLTTRGITDAAAASELLRSLAQARMSLNDDPRGILTTVDGISLLDNAATALWRAAAHSAGLAAVPRGWKWVARA
jgi:ATP-dependent Lhr-like helicase